MAQPAVFDELDELEAHHPLIPSLVGESFVNSPLFNDIDDTLLGRPALCMARTLPFHSLCIVLTATALTATGMSQSAPGHPGLRGVQQANLGSDNGLDYTTSWIGNTFGGNTTGPRHGYAPRSGGRARHLCHSRWTSLY